MKKHNKNKNKNKDKKSKARSRVLYKPAKRNNERFAPVSNVNNTPVRRVSLGKPVLRFSPTAYAKLLYVRDLGSTEISGFAVCRKVDDLFCVNEFHLVKQTASAAFVEFDDDALADFQAQKFGQGLQPNQYGRIWLHTHPSDGVTPSGTDEDTFAKIFGSYDWSIMFILGKQGSTYARLQHKIGNTNMYHAVEMDVKFDMSVPFEASDFAAWKAEYDLCVQQKTYTQGYNFPGYTSGKVYPGGYGDFDGYDGELFPGGANDQVGFQREWRGGRHQLFNGHAPTDPSKFSWIQKDGIWRRVTKTADEKVVVNDTNTKNVENVENTENNDKENKQESAIVD